MSPDDDRITKPAFDHFGLLAPVYDKLIKSPQPDILLKLLKPNHTDSILDVGGGTGRCVRQFPGLFSQNHRRLPAN